MPVAITEIVTPRKVFTCSDGSRFYSAKKAYKHEMYLRIPTLFPQNAIERCRTYKGKHYYLCRSMFIRCGVYHIVLKNKEDLSTMNHFFHGIREALDYPDKDDYPIEFDLELYHEDMPKLLIDRAQWRLYDEKANTETHG